MQNKPRYKNELLDIYDFFEQKIKYLKKIGIKHNNIIIDPGIGFGKILKHNINLISKISIFHSLGFPILVGSSRKRFIKEIAGKSDSKSRVGGTVASSIYLMMQGIQILRIHDVNEILQGIKVFREIYNDKLTYFNDEESLQFSLEKCLQLKKHQNETKNNKFFEKFTWEKTCAKMLQVYENC